jgi:hypothetical protein
MIKSENNVEDQTDQHQLEADNEVTIHNDNKRVDFGKSVEVCGFPLYMLENIIRVIREKSPSDLENLCPERKTSESDSDARVLKY